jgi:methionyl-tRNA formyltransferase
VRTVFLGTSEFAATVLRRIADSPHRPLLAVTPPDRPKGRGRHTLPPPAAAAAGELGIPLLQTKSVNQPEAIEAIHSAAPEVAAVCAFGQLIREPLLDGLEMLNVHPSLLPRWRGAAPIERAIMAGDEKTGISIMRVTAGLDSGPVALQGETAIGADEDFGALEPRLAHIGGELIVRALDLREAGKLELFEQDEAAATYAEKISPDERRLDPTRPASELARSVRALTPHIGAYLDLEDGGRLGVRRAAAEAGAAETGKFFAEDRSLGLGCAKGVLRLEIVQPPNGRPMTADAYLRGHTLPPRAV